MAEHLRKCESFAELRIAMRVVLQPCGQCGLTHELSLVEKKEAMPVYDERHGDWEIVWLTAPRTSCAPRERWANTLGITHRSVQQGRVFIVEERDEQQATTTRKLERVD